MFTNPAVAQSTLQQNFRKQCLKFLLIFQRTVSLQSSFTENNFQSLMISKHQAVLSCLEFVSITDLISSLTRSSHPLLSLISKNKTKNKARDLISCLHSYKNSNPYLYLCYPSVNQVFSICKLYRDCLRVWLLPKCPW